MKHSVRGGITCILGPMFSGKTTELLRLHDRQNIAKKNCILVKYAGDTRYDDNLVATHTKVTGQGNTVKCSRLEEVRAALFDVSIDVVSIDEGQFFPDLAITCDQLAEAGKRVYVAALSGTFERKAFPQITILLPFCDDIELLSAVCSCGTDACYTFRCTKDKKIEIIGGQDAYMALCRSCFNLKSLERDRDEIGPRTPQDHTAVTSILGQDQKYTEVEMEFEKVTKSEEDKIPERRLGGRMVQNNRRFTERPHQLLIGVVIVVAVVFLVQYNWYSGNYQTLREKYTLFKECFKAGTEGHDAKTFWDNYGTVANRCESLLGLTTSRLQGFKNRDETKYHILPIDSSADSIILSLGIGHDADAEKALKPALSEGSIFVGADPDITNHDVYRVVGTYLPMAVGKDSGNVTVNHLMHMGTTGYASGSTFMITLTTLIKEYLPKKTTMIDDIWVDIEYSEYKILDLFHNSADIFREGYSVCQFNLEAHWPNDEQKTVFHNFTKQLLEDGRYAFVKVSTFAGHWRILFVDYLDKRCADKYLLGN